MEQQLKEFLADSQHRVQFLFEELENLCRFSPEQREWRETVIKLFRQVHTLKGIAAAFELESVKLIAHEIENFLEIVNLNNCSEILPILEQGLKELENAFSSAIEKQEFEVSAEKLAAWKDVFNQTKNIKPAFFKKGTLPEELEQQLKPHELAKLQNAFLQNTQIFIINAGFPIACFANDFQALQKKLNENGEIITALPDAANKRSAEINLNLIFISKIKEKELSESVESLGCKISLVIEREAEKPKLIEKKSGTTAKFSNLCKTPLLAAQKIAISQGKQVAFETIGEDIEFKGSQVEACEIALLHLLRNAVFHGIEQPFEREQAGKQADAIIQIESWFENDACYLRVTDDGRGIDGKKVKQAAIERGVIINKFEENLPESLIFLPGFSTANTLSSEAGRGIGLDAVKAAVAEAGGSVNVSSQAGLGASFLICLPNKDRN